MHDLSQMARVLAMHGANCGSLARRTSGVLLLAIACLLNACGGGGDTGDRSTGGTGGGTAPPPPPPPVMTASGVVWLDSAGYTKPAFFPIAVPDEATVTNKYFIDLTSGAGTT